MRRRRPARRILETGLVIILAVLPAAWPVIAQDSRYSPSWTPPTASDVEASLVSLSFRDFLDESYKHYLLWFPAIITQNGIEALCDVRNDRIYDFSDAAQHEMHAVEQVIYEGLLRYDRSHMSEQEQLWYDAYAWIWQRRLEAQRTAFPNRALQLLSGSPLSTYKLLTQWHPLRSVTDVEDYLCQMSQIPEQLEQMRAILETAAAEGIIPYHGLITTARADFRQIYETGYNNALYATLNRGLQEIDSVDSSERSAYLAEASRLLRDEIQPAFRAFSAVLQSLLSVAPAEPSLAQYPDGGDAFRRDLLYRTQLTDEASEIHRLACEELDRLTERFSTLAPAVGWPPDQTFFVGLTPFLSSLEWIEGRASITREYERLIAKARGRLGDAFYDYGSPDVAVLPRYQDWIRYVPASYDGVRDAAVWFPKGGTRADPLTVQKLAYHEAFPGHHLQLTVGQQSDLPLFLSLTYRPFSWCHSLLEGWARYAESLAFELGWFDEDPYGELRVIESQMTDYLHVALWSGLHGLGWTHQEAANFLIERTGLHADSLERYAVSSLNGFSAVAYGLGGHQLRELRADAEAALGDTFDLREYHDIILRQGMLPLHLLSGVVQNYVETKRGG